MNLLSIYKVSLPSAEKVPADKEKEVYRQLRNRTFWGACTAYSLYYVCRLALSVVKQPLIDGGVLSASQLGLIGSAMLFVYAIGKFMNDDKLYSHIDSTALNASRLLEDLRLNPKRYVHFSLFGKKDK